MGQCRTSSVPPGHYLYFQKLLQSRSCSRFNLQRRLSCRDACKPVAGQIKTYTAKTLILNIVETGWKTKENAATLWTFVSDLCVYFLISASRGAKILEEVLGPVFNGVIGSDDHSAYSAYLKNGKRQLCWPHLIKKTQGAQKQPSQPGSLYLCQKHAEGNGRLFTYWHAYLESDCSLEQLYHATTLIRARMKKYCYKYSE